MTETLPPPVPRTPEQHAAVRRRALPVSISAAILGVGGLIWMLASPVTAFRPPNPYAINLSFCAMLFGVGIIFYAKGTQGTRAAVILSIIAVLASLFGPMIFALQVVQYNKFAQNLELENVAAIAAAANQYAAAHEGRYASDLLTLLEDALPVERLRSPLAFNRDPRQRTGALANLKAMQATTSRDDVLRSVETESDYLYLGAELNAVAGKPVAGQIIVACSTRTVLRVRLALAYADARAQYITMDDVPRVMSDNDAARKSIGLGPMKPPAIIQKVIDEAASRPAR